LSPTPLPGGIFDLTRFAPGVYGGLTKLKTRFGLTPLMGVSRMSRSHDGAISKLRKPLAKERRTGELDEEIRNEALPGDADPVA
jgi:hypothetical protein